MNKLYFGLPLAVAVAFWAFFHFSFAPRHDAAVKKAADEASLQKQLVAMKEQEERVRVANIAKKESEERQKARADEKARLAKEAEDRQLALAKRDSERSKSDRLAQDIDRVKREIAEEESEIKKTNEEKSGYETERDFLKNYVAQANKNKDRLLELVAKIDEVEKKRADDAAAAAKAAKGKQPSS